MSRPAIFLVASLIVSGAYAQEADKARTLQSPQSPQPPTSGTAPHHMGSTGWTGGSTGAGTGSNTAPAAHQNINRDSEYATGSNLQGPAAQFPPGRTPE